MKHLRSIVVATALFTAAGPVAAQQSVEFFGDLGFTGTDAEGWAGVGLTDWETLMSGGHAQLFLLERDRVRIGAELGYQYLLWYQFQSAGFYVSRDVDAFRVMAVARTPFTPTVFGEVTAGFYAFGDFIDPAIGAAVGGHIPLSERWSIPVKLRVNTVFDADANMIPIGLAVGAAYDFGSATSNE